MTTIIYKKMVKNSDTGQQENTMVSTNKLTRLKQTLTIGFQQAQDSGTIRYGIQIFFKKKPAFFL